MDTNHLSILMLGGAKRVAIARLFAQAARRLGYEADFYSYELSEEEAIADVATVIKGLRWADPAIYSDLLSIIKRHNIRLVVPFVDGAIQVAANLVAMGADIFVPTGSAEAAAVCLDKLTLAEAFTRLELPQPKLYAADASSLALIAKPRHGAASKGLKVVNLNEIAPNASACIVQQYIASRTEYSVDCYASVATGEVLAAAARRRIDVVGGEVIDTITVDEPDVTTLAIKAIELLGLRGAITVQILRDNTDGRLYLMEINPRLGGGAVCSVEAGADIPECILRECLGLPQKQFRAEAGVRLKRYMDGKIFKNSSL